MMGKSVGIDLGTAFSAIAVVKENGEPAVLPNRSGDLLTASVLSFPSPGVVNVGHVDLQAQVPPDRILSAVKREMGKSDFGFRIDGREIGPVFGSALILRKLKQDAEQQIGPIHRAVITVPYYFNEQCRQATREAGRIAGLEVLDVVNEPTAATLSYAWNQGLIQQSAGQPRYLLVYDLGGGTFDVAVVQCVDGHLRVLATDGDTYLGGIDWTNRIVNELKHRLDSSSRASLAPGSVPGLQFHEACERAKCLLSEQPVVTVDSQGIPGIRNLILTRSEFEDWTADLVQRTVDTVELVLEESGLQSENLTDVLLIGGSSCMPSIRQMLRSSFGITDTHPIEPRLAVAEGAALHAAMLDFQAGHLEDSGKTGLRDWFQSLRVQDVNSHSLGVELTDPRTGEASNHVMIPRNSSLPVQIMQRFVTSQADPDGIRIRLLEGERPDPESCTRIAEIRITDLPAHLPAGTPVEVTYSYDERRRIHVSARELSGQASAEVQLVWESGHGPNHAMEFNDFLKRYAIE